MTYQCSPADTVKILDEWLDSKVSQQYKDQPLAQDWARCSKVIEELGEVIRELISYTGQNPRKVQDDDARKRMLNELADTMITTVLAIQHFTKDARQTNMILSNRWQYRSRMAANSMYGKQQ